VQFNCVKRTVQKTELDVLWHSTNFRIRLVSSVCLLVRVTGGQKQGGCLPLASHIGHNVIRKEEKKA
jgi:hypothetical protein